MFVNKPGDLTEKEAVPKIMQLLNRFEKASGSVGPISTHMWLFSYLPYTGIQVLILINLQIMNMFISCLIKLNKEIIEII